ncbi:60S ribosomal protein L20 [Mortierella hygrophila]|uniref:60S ribosomal protein L20 n=2 Tax=Mortierellaceae TaxID=4854 RepID=A0A9P6K5P0_9FUNG|nr:60S ribosomal protein L20 [Mortierella hygrophila]
MSLPSSSSTSTSQRVLSSMAGGRWQRLWEDGQNTVGLSSAKEALHRCNGFVLTLLSGSATLHEYQLVGRHLPTEKDATPKLFRMRLFATNEVIAKSRFWYFMRKLKKVKKVNGEIVGINEIHEKKPLQIKNFGIWIRYDSRSGTHNMYKEYRELSRNAAVEACYSDMASRHRARSRSIQIIRVAEVANADVRRPYIKQILVPGIKFPLPHRVIRSADKAHRALFMGSRPSTFY